MRTLIHKIVRLLISKNRILNYFRIKKTILYC